MTFTRVGIIVAITAVVVYAALNFLFPRNLPEAKQEAAATADQVFGSNTAAAPAAPAAGGLSEEEARKIAQDVGSKVGAQVAQSVVDKEKAPAQSGEQAAATSAAPAEQPAARPSSAEQPAAAAPAGGSEQPKTAVAEAPASPPPAEAPAPASAPAESVPPPAEEAPAPKPAKQHEKKAATSSAPVSGKAAASGAWWPPAGKPSPKRLNLLYAGDAGFEDAVMLRFSGVITPAAAASHIKVLDGQGHAVKGNWGSGSNPRVLVFQVKSGHYTVVLPADLADTSGKKLGSTLQGPVYVH